MRNPALVRTAAGIAVLTAALALTGCQSLTMPTPSPTATSGGGSSGQTGGGAGDAETVDVSKVIGAEPSGDLTDPCSLLTTAEIEAATGVRVLGVVRGVVHSDGHQICAYAMDAGGAPAAALAGAPSLPVDSQVGALIAGMKGAGGIVGVELSAQDPQDNVSGDDDGDGPPPQIQMKKLDLGKGALAVGTPNGGGAVAANPTNVELTIMDLIKGPVSADTMATLLTTAYGRLES